MSAKTNYARQLHALMTRPEFLGNTRPSTDSMRNRLISVYGKQLRDADIYLILQELHDRLNDVVSAISEALEDETEKQAFIKPLKALGGIIAPKAMNNNFSYEANEQNISHLILVSTLLNNGSVLQDIQVEHIDLQRSLDQLLQQLGEIDLRPDLSRRINRVLSGAKFFFEERHTFGSDLAWARFAELLLIVVREGANAKDPKQRQWFKKAGQVVVSCIAALAVTNAAWDDVSELIGKGSKAAGYLVELFEGDTKQIGYDAPASNDESADHSQTN